MADIERRAHIVRLKGKNSDGETLDDVWLDIRRADKILMVDQGTIQARIVTVKWDDGFGDKPNDPDRMETVLKVTDPTNPPANPNNPEVYVPVPVVDQLAVNDADQKIILIFRNKRDDDKPTTRKLRLTRVYHADTSNDPLSDPIDAKSYQRRDPVDQSQYVDAEVVEEYTYDDADQGHTDIYAIDDDALIKSFPKPPPDAGLPVRLDPLQNIVNVNWGGEVYVLINIQGGANFFSATREVVANADGDVVPSTVTISGATPLYSRVTSIVYDMNSFDQVVVYGLPTDGFPLSSTTITDGFVLNYDPRATDGTGQHFFIFAASNTAGIAAKRAQIDTFSVHSTSAQQAYTNSAASVEAVFLLDSPKEFTVTTGGFPFTMDVYIYPKSALKRDNTNDHWAVEGLPQDSPFVEPGGRVWFPINWKTTPPPYPLDPEGNEWPGYANILYSPNERDVINTAIFWVFLSAQGASDDSESYPFKVEKREHWSSQPDVITAQLADKIWQVYPTTVSAGDNWAVFSYAIKPLGIVRSSPGSWSFLTVPGPLPLISPET